MTRKIGLLPFVIFVTFVPQPRTSVWGGLGEPSESADGGAISQIDPLRAIHRQPQHRDQPHLRLSPVLFPPPVAREFADCRDCKGRTKMRWESLPVYWFASQNPQFHSIWGYKSTQPLWNRKGTRARDRGQRCGRTTCVTRMTA